MKKYFFSWMREHLRHNPHCVLLLCDLGYPEALDLIALHPDHVINVGVAEQNAALLAKGLCSQGFEVFIYGISSFTLWRAAEGLRMYFDPTDRLRVIGNGGGFGYGIMGSSHHSLDDLGLVSLWRHWTSWIPRRDQELTSLLKKVSPLKGPHYIRLTNNDLPTTDEFCALSNTGGGERVTVVTYGPLLDLVLPVLKDDSDVQIFGINTWPLDVKTIQSHFEKSQRIVFFEEHQIEGSLSQKIASVLEGPRAGIHIHAISQSSTNGSRNYLLASQGFESQNIRRNVNSIKA
ncbi:hypothetical protein AZI86_15250 [Bdellovibrio bacteriovorus]|uniref:Transketolase-like pyrimidine-binding domain-containing protein n=1 Tax=Bdellovibrio bacteriovorus TaxID=959 RepID=A0A150WHJ2_BDEBC|nr:transketolase C-terminal domain-containing protein [Bdellovibrio bacteriovorus]KYG63074.1 hypothetical protein AZI86_15250 [Bdellovibrio bacteriovorus]